MLGGHGNDGGGDLPSPVVGPRPQTAVPGPADDVGPGRRGATLAALPGARATLPRATLAGARATLPRPRGPKPLGPQPP